MPLVRRVGLFARLLALLLDVVLFLPVLVVLVVLAVLLDQLPSPPPGGLQQAVLPLGWLVYSAAELVWGATPGKLILGLRVGTARGSRADFWTRFLRWSTKQLPVICMALLALTGFILFHLLGGFLLACLLVGFLAAANDDKRSWLDEWSGTAVYRRRDLLPPRPPSPILAVPPPLPPPRA